MQGGQHTAVSSSLSLALISQLDSLLNADALNSDSRETEKSLILAKDLTLNHQSFARHKTQINAL